MKTLNEMNFLNFSYNKPLLRTCSKLKEFYGRCASLFVEYWLPGAPIQLKTLESMGVLQIYRAGVAAVAAFLIRVSAVLRASLNEVWSNKRFRVGLVLGMVALPAWKCHLFFDIDARYEDFYYVNYAFYFNTIRAYVCGVFIATGFFLCAPQKWMFRWLALPVVLFCATEIYQQSFYTSWQDFYNPMPNWQIVLLLFSAIYPVFLSFNYLLYRKYHLKDGNSARIRGILQMPGVPIKQKYELLERMIKEQEEFNARV